LKYLCLTTL